MSRLGISLAAVLSLAVAPAAAAADLFVTTTGNDANDGLSWASALGGPEAAVNVARSSPEPDTIHVAAGLYRREEGVQLVLADIAGQEVRVAKADIAARIETETSLMPPAFGEAIPPAGLNDLLAFLLGKRPAK